MSRFYLRWKIRFLQLSVVMMQETQIQMGFDKIRSEANCFQEGPTCFFV
jgi:hypothetical protein